MPSNELDTQVSNLMVAELIGSFERYCKDREEVRSLYPWADRFVMGLPLAPWQRPAVWSADKQQRFIVSMWAGIDLGTYMVNRKSKFLKNGSLCYLSDAVVDGQQRLLSIQKYLLNKIAVPDVEGTLRHWKDLGKVQRRRFFSIGFACSQIHSLDETDNTEVVIDKNRLVVTYSVGNLRCKCTMKPTNVLFVPEYEFTLIN